MNPSLSVKITGEQWASYKRYKVNSVVKYNDVSYQNITGINSDPSVENNLNWFVIKENNLKKTFSILVFGNEFELKKHPLNDNPNNFSVLENNDFILNGFRNNNEFWDKAQCIDATNKDSENSWTVLGSSEDLILI